MGATMFAALALAIPMVGISTAGASAADGKGVVTGLPVPRFVSLKSDKVNMRVGPGKKYAIDWRYERKGLPVEVIQEFDRWRKVRDADGTEGWVKSGYLVVEKPAGA